MWAVHYVEGTAGAQLHPGLDQDRIDAVVAKGRDRDDPGCSRFAGTELAKLLREELVTAVTVVGLATGYCVEPPRWTPSRRG